MTSEMNLLNKLTPVAWRLSDDCNAIEILLYAGNSLLLLTICYKYTKGTGTQKVLADGGTSKVWSSLSEDQNIPENVFYPQWLGCYGMMV